MIIKAGPICYSLITPSTEDCGRKSPSGGRGFNGDIWPPSDAGPDSDGREPRLIAISISRLDLHGTHQGVRARWGGLLLK